MLISTGDLFDIAEVGNFLWESSGFEILSGIVLPFGDRYLSIFFKGMSKFSVLAVSPAVKMIIVLVYRYIYSSLNIYIFFVVEGEKIKKNIRLRI